MEIEESGFKCKVNFDRMILDSVLLRLRSIISCLFLTSIKKEIHNVGKIIMRVIIMGNTLNKGCTDEQRAERTK